MADVRAIMGRLRIAVARATGEHERNVVDLAGSKRERNTIAARITRVVEGAGRSREGAETIGKAVAERYVARAAAFGESALEMLERANIAVRRGDAWSPVGKRLREDDRQFLQIKGSGEDAKIQRPGLQSDTAAPNEGKLKIINSHISPMVRQEAEGKPPERQTPTRMLAETTAAPNTEMSQLKPPNRVEGSNPEIVNRQGMRSWVEDPVSTELSSKRKLEIPNALEREGNGNRSARIDTDGQAAHYRDFDAAIARLSAEMRLPHTPAADGEFVAGNYRQDVTLNSGRFAVIDNGLGFALVPWAPELDRHRDRHVTGVAKESGEIEWSFGRKRGLEI